jgi:small subunit ribosomal protein S5
MDTEETKTESTEVIEPSLAADVAVPAAAPAKGAYPPRRNERDRKPRREPRAKPEFDQRILNIRRVTRVSSGGRRFSFSVAMVVGNHKGMVGVGTGKAGDTSLAIDKATRSARKNAITVKTTPSMSIPHEVYAKEKSAYVHIQPARGKGIIAGSSVRDVIELAGLKDINAKLRSPSKNKLNAARAAVKALTSLKTPIVREKREHAK